MERQYSNILISPQELKFTMEKGGRVPRHQFVTLQKDGHNLTPPWSSFADDRCVFHKPVDGRVPKNVRVGISNAARTYLPGTYDASLKFVTVAGSAILPSPIVSITLEISGEESPTPPVQPAQTMKSPSAQENWLVRLWRKLTCRSKD